MGETEVPEESLGSQIITMKDLRGSEIKIGSMVAYNRGGNVVLGQVAGLRRKHVLAPRTMIMVRAMDDNKVSKVTRPRLMVLMGYKEDYV